MLLRIHLRTFSVITVRGRLDSGGFKYGGWQEFYRPRFGFEDGLLDSILDCLTSSELNLTLTGVHFLCRSPAVFLSEWIGGSNDTGIDRALPVGLRGYADVSEPSRIMTVKVVVDRRRAYYSQIIKMYVLCQ